MKKLYAERLLQVVRVLEELPLEKKFDLETWNVCGTVGCAVGWAASDPWFTRRGLKLGKHSQRPWQDFVSSLRRKLHRGGYFQQYQLIYQGAKDWAAVWAFFDINPSNAGYLFDKPDYNNPTKCNVIRRIKAFVKANT